MIFTTDVKMRLEELKDKMLLGVKANTDPLRIESVTLYYITGWKTEEVPPRRGLFSRAGYTKLTEIRVMFPKHVGTKFIGVKDGWLDSYIELCEKNRKLFLKLKEDMDKFGFEVTKTKEIH